MSWDRDYLELCFRLQRHIPNLVDVYFGPAEVPEQVAAEDPRDTEDLIEDTHRLQQSVGSEKDQARRQFMQTQLRGIEAMAHKANGDPVTFEDEVRACYDIEPVGVDEQQIEESTNQMQEALSCRLDQLPRALDRWRDRYRIPSGSIARYWDAVCAEARERTCALLELPEDESVEVRYVRGVSWAGYNWYLGNFRSRVDINLGAQQSCAFLPQLATHEAYPGHHVERCIKEQVLYRRKHYLEASILLYGTAECVVSEGIAQVAKLVAFGTEEALLDWSNATLGTQFHPEQDAAVLRALDRLDLRGNAALRLHVDGQCEKEVASYVQRVGLQPPSEAKRLVHFAASYGAYAVSYYEGARLIRESVDLSDPAQLHTLYSTQLAPASITQCFQGRRS
jgi:hypothetical protein